MQISINRGSPLGEHRWIEKVVKKLGLEDEIRPRGRSRKKEEKVVSVHARVVTLLIACYHRSPLPLTAGFALDATGFAALTRGYCYLTTLWSGDGSIMAGW